MMRRSAVVLILAFGISAPGRISGQKAVHPDESADYTMNERLSIRQSLESLAAIESALNSFRKLTEAAAKTMPKEQLAKIGNTGWEMQNLGFVNHVQSVKGTLLKQEFLIKKLAYELAQRKSKAGELDSNSLSNCKREYEKAEREFQQFWKTFGIAD